MPRAQAVSRVVSVSSNGSTPLQLASAFGISPASVRFSILKKNKPPATKNVVNLPSSDYSFLNTINLFPPLTYRSFLFFCYIDLCFTILKTLYPHDTLSMFNHSKLPTLVSVSSNGSTPLQQRTCSSACCDHTHVSVSSNG